MHFLTNIPDLAEQSLNVRTNFYASVLYICSNVPIYILMNGQIQAMNH